MTPEDVQLGVCSWSLRPISAEDLVDAVRVCGLRRVQLALDPVRRGVWDASRAPRIFSQAGLEFVSGMMEFAGADYTSIDSIRETGGVRPTARWEQNLGAARADARLAAAFGIELVTFHAGFIPDDPGSEDRAVMVERLRRLAEVFAAQSVTIALETGQEDTETLCSVLDELDDLGVGVNFDPANMILYGTGDPVAAARRIGSRIRQVHIKDALPSDEPGVTWGTEVPVGTGAVDWPAFLAAIEDVAPAAPLVIEREAGEQRATDIRVAVRHLEALAASRSSGSAA